MLKSVPRNCVNETYTEVTRGNAVFNSSTPHLKAFENYSTDNFALSKYQRGNHKITFIKTTEPTEDFIHQKKQTYWALSRARCGHFFTLVIAKKEEDGGQEEGKSPFFVPPLPLNL